MNYFFSLLISSLTLTSISLLTSSPLATHTSPLSLNILNKSRTLFLQVSLHGLCSNASFSERLTLIILFKTPTSMLLLILFLKILFIYLAVPGLSCRTQDLRSSLWHTRSLLAARGIQFPDQGSNLASLLSLFSFSYWPLGYPPLLSSFANVLPIFVLACLPLDIYLLSVIHVENFPHSVTCFFTLF